MIKIINGVFGFNDGTSVIPKTSKDEPFEAGEKIEKELVAKGVAEYVGKTDAVVEVEEETVLTIGVKVQCLLNSSLACCSSFFIF